jgi:Flp pilus assembly protein TadG
LGPRTWDVVQKPIRRRSDARDERGAEMIEFAIVVVLLIALLYGIITYGLILAAQATVTQAAADAARAGLVASATAKATAEEEAANDLGWMNKGTCYQPDVPPSGLGSASATTTCVASEAPCPSNSSIQCLSVTVKYNYSSNPLFPELPGLGLITPSTISSTNVVQLGSVS